MTGSQFALAKPCFDVGYFTANPVEMLSFWREEMGLQGEEPVEFNDGLTQYRHALGDSVIKINTSRSRIEDPPAGYSELIIAQANRVAPKLVRDPDGNRILLVPPGHDGIEGVGLRLSIRDLETHRKFLRDIMRFEPISENSFRSGNSLLLLDERPDTEAAGHWVNHGLRYFTLQVMRVDECFQAMVEAGATIGEAPYSIGNIARISFIRDPDGNWIEVAQRAALAGHWDA